MFGKDFPLELERIAQLHEFMRVAGVAILATELAAAVRIDHPVKRDARAIASRQEFAAGQIEILDPVFRFEGGAFGGEPSNADEFRHALYSPFVRL
jgi:hypothetical protein